MVPILVIVFLLVPLAELAVLIAVGEWIGLVPTLILAGTVVLAGCGSGRPDRPVPPVTRTVSQGFASA